MQNNKNKGVYISVLNQGSIRPEIATLMADLPNQNKYNLIIDYPANKPISHNRNKIVKRFLETDMDYLLMMDGDCVPPPEILELADYDKDIIGAVCYGYLKKMIIPFVMKKNAEGTFNVLETCEESGVVECDAIGTGVIMIKREVLENLQYPFRNEYDPDGIKTKGLDFNFCSRAKKIGYKVFAQTDFTCSHWTVQDLKTIHKTYNQIRKEAIAAIKQNEFKAIPKGSQSN